MRHSPARDRRAPRRWLVAVWPCVALAAAEPAAAQSTPAEGVPVQSTPLPVQSTPLPVQSTPTASGDSAQGAEELLNQGRPLLLEAHRLFRAGDPAASIPLLERAYQLGKWPGCLLNLAMAHHALAHCHAALDYYQRYLGADPYTERHGEVAAALAELTDICGGAAPELADRPAEPASRHSPRIVAGLPPSPHRAVPLPAAVPAGPSPSRALEWSLLGTGLASGVAALGFALASRRKEMEASRFDSFTASDPRARDVHEAGVRYNRLSLGLGLSSLALLGSGAALWLWSPAAPAALDEAIAGLQYRGRF